MFIETRVLSEDISYVVLVYFSIYIVILIICIVINSNINLYSNIMYYCMRWNIIIQ